MELFYSATDRTMLCWPETTYMVPQKNNQASSDSWRGCLWAGDMLETFSSPLKSCPSCLELYGRTQRLDTVEPLCHDMGNALPTALTVLSGLHPVPLPSGWKRKKQICYVVLSVIFLPCGRQREPVFLNFFTGIALHEREAAQQIHFLAASDQVRAQFLLAIFFFRAETRS